MYRTDALGEERQQVRFLLESFHTQEEAVAFAEDFVDRVLRRHYWARPGVSGTELFGRWFDLGEKPFIPGSWFVAKDYARMRAPEIARELWDTEDDRR